MKTNKARYDKGYRPIRGEKREAWLRGVSACRSPDGIIRPQANLRSIKIPIEGGCGWEYDEILPAYRPIVETGDGSLLDYLLTLHQAGFRFFASSGRARNFRYRHTLCPPGLPASARAAFGQDSPLADGAQDVLSALTTKPRRTPGKAKFKAEDYARGLATVLKEVLLGADAPDAAKAWCETTATQVMERFGDIFQAAEQQQDYLDFISAAFAKQGISLDLATMAQQLQPMVPKSSSIEFDPDANSHDAVIQHGSDALYGVMARYAQEVVGESAAKKAKAIQGKIVTGNATAWAWVLGAGWRYFREATVDEILADYRMPANRRSHAEQIKTAAQKIPTPHLLYRDKNYAKYRQQLAGQVNSFISTAMSRVDELQAVLAQAQDIVWPTHLNAELSQFTASLDISLDDLIDQLAREKTDRAQIRRVLEALAGQSSGAISASDLIAIDEHAALLSTVGATINRIKARIKTEKRLNENAGLKAGREDALLEALPQDVPRQKKLPRIEVAVALPAQSQKDDIDAFNALRAFVQEQTKTLQSQASDPFAARVHRQEKQIAAFQARSKTGPMDAARLAARDVVSLIAKAARTGSQALKTKVADDLYTKGFLSSKRNANKFMLNEQGEIFRSLHAMFSGARHKPYAWGFAVVDSQAIENWLGELIQWAEQRLQDVDIHQGERINDLLLMEWMQVRWQIMGLPESLPTPDVDTFVSLGVEVPQGLRISLQGDTSTRTAVERLYRSVISEMRGIGHRLFRQDVIARSVLKPTGLSKILYLPRADQASWTPSKNLQNSTSALATYLYRSTDSKGKPRLDDDGAVNVLAQLKDTLAQAELAEVGFTEFLTQAPHEFGCKVPWVAEQVRAAVGIQKDGRLDKRVRDQQAAALIMPPKWATLFNRAIGSQGVLAWGDCQLIVEHRFAHDVQFNGGQITGSSKPVGARAYLVVPVTREEVAPKEAAFPFETRAMGIDLGERGVAFAVKDWATGETVKTGFIRVPELRGVMRSANRKAPWDQRQQKYDIRIDPKQIEVRKAAVGAVAHVIDSLMAEHRAIPIFENNPSGHVGGNRDIARVYDHVSQLYLFSGVDAHMSVRKHHWRSKYPSWEWPEWEVKKKQANGTYKTEPLKFYPGVSVSGAGTSQTCSSCQRNPIAALKDRTGKAVVLAPGGTLEVANGTLRLQVKGQESESERKSRRRRLERPSIHAPASAGELPMSDALRTLKSQLRQAPKSLQSRDSKQSRYTCAYADCSAELHADTNAALNLVSNWIEVRKPTQIAAAT